jgi:hypothetical protein
MATVTNGRTYARLFVDSMKFADSSFPVKVITMSRSFQIPAFMISKTKQLHYCMEVRLGIIARAEGHSFRRITLGHASVTGRRFPHCRRYVGYANYARKRKSTFDVLQNRGLCIAFQLLTRRPEHTATVA